MPKKIDDPAMNEAITQQKLNIKRLKENIGKFVSKEKGSYQP